MFPPRALKRELLLIGARGFEPPTSWSRSNPRQPPPRPQTSKRPDHTGGGGALQAFLTLARRGGGSRMFRIRRGALSGRIRKAAGPPVTASCGAGGAAARRAWAGGRGGVPV